MSSVRQVTIRLRKNRFCAQERSLGVGGHHTRDDAQSSEEERAGAALQEDKPGAMQPHIVADRFSNIDH